IATGGAAAGAGVGSGVVGITGAHCMPGPLGDAGGAAGRPAAGVGAWPRNEGLPYDIGDSICTVSTRPGPPGAWPSGAACTVAAGPVESAGGGGSPATGPGEAVGGRAEGVGATPGGRSGMVVIALAPTSAMRTICTVMLS